MLPSILTNLNTYSCIVVIFDILFNNVNQKKRNKVKETTLSFVVWAVFYFNFGKRYEVKQRNRITNDNYFLKTSSEW